MERLNLKDLLGGLLFGGMGVFFLVGGLGMRFGTADRMGPGYLPVVLSVILIGLSMITLTRAFRTVGTPIEVSWRPLIWVPLSTIAFGVVFLRFGFVPAIIATVFLASLADRESRPLGTVLVAAFLAASAWLIFRVGLGLPMPAFRGF